MKINKLISLLILGVAILLAIITRFYKLGEVPAGLYLDEAAQGYNAYSILKTGKDEFGKSFPIVFRSFADFKTPVYTYLIVPLIPIFDLTKFTVRFPSFFFSVLTLPILYFLIKNITSTRYALPVASISVLLLAISPWHILFGRTDFECTVALFLFLAGILFFYIGLDKPKNFLLSAILLGISIPAYQAERVVVPLIILVLFLKYKRVLLSKTHIKYLILGSVIGFVILIPTIFVSNTPGFLARAGLNIFNFEKQKPAGYLENCNSEFICKIVNSRTYLHTREFSALYVSYFSPRNMFVLGDYGPRSSFPELSTFFLWQFPFYLAGLYWLVKKRDLSKLKFLVISLLLICPIPAALTRDPYTTIRALPMVIPQIIIISLGIYELFVLASTFLKKYLPLNLVYLLWIVLSLSIITYSLLRLYSSVLILNEFHRAVEWNFGFEEIAGEIKKFDQNVPVVFDNARNEPYSQLLFFLKPDPETYQKDNFEVPLYEYYTNMNRNKEKNIGKIKTRSIEWKIDLSSDKYLIGDNLAISYDQINSHKLTLVSEIKFPDGSVAYRIVRTNPNFENSLH